MAEDTAPEAEGLASRFLALELEQSALLRALPLEEPVSHVYNPLEYAWEPHRDFVRRYCRAAKRVLFLGMNPGPFGMAQTGVPFGEAWHVREWLRVTGRVGKPPSEHPKRPVLGLECRQAEGFAPGWSEAPHPMGSPVSPHPNPCLSFPPQPPPWAIKPLRAPERGCRLLVVAHGCRVRMPCGVWGEGIGCRVGAAWCRVGAGVMPCGCCSVPW
ncbi:single-strand selective monofunctional uracil DNA glycosylase isoform X3 [Rhea pennata]|uniref:single-strand selective monofunctional uracil DNA glycosylase isoform X3 n=1 Tax=Rhea pennata TaxID=8795 RepID=UPI002E2633EF